MSGETAAVRLDDVSKVYGRNGSAVRALDGVSVAIPRGSFTAVMGPSGSGKSTFLHCAAGLDRVTAGSAWLAGVEISGLNERRATEVRRERVGFVFQAFNLVPALTVRHNVGLPLRLTGRRIDRRRVEGALARVGLGGKADARPTELSGGQQQRVAIARALITEPDVIFGDEPTGALDTVTAKSVLELLRGIVRESGQTVVMVTHDPVAASYADTVLFLADGRLVGEMTEPTAERVADRMTRMGAWA
ncbi:ABC transporter ATP-binding protein [Streptomyces sp. 8K308]|uniref:ABC transporter ATP-binding protein n=1 Tax=Streptomyces sp. 8K308 TaxID=2530388 RepID=UPI0010530B1B|nr:ABC transporter ATP-binding protein [Streptomyces sp. 8K308]TDC13236.1 ABC transporter ATP-binding protein [Streptomyces sp. 8K308]